MIRRITALAAGAILTIGLVTASATMAHATTWTDTAVQAVPPPVNCGHISVSGNGSATLTYTAAGGSLVGSTDTITGSGLTVTITAASVVINGTAGHAGSVALSLVFASASCGRTAVLPVVTVTETSLAGDLQSGSLPSGDVSDAITLNHPVNDNGTGQVDFSGTSSPAILPVAVSAGNLPAGLTGGTETALLPGTAAPGTYHFVTEVATDGSGALAFDEFTLKVIAHVSSGSGSLGDEVNQFGNGLDVFRQQYHAGAIVAGWTATKGDPATNFIRIAHGSAWQFEATKAGGAASGLCVSDPGGGWPDPAGPDGLLITPCNNGPFQQFTIGAAQPGGSELVNVATGKIVNPNGTGAQLTGGTAPTPWGGSGYTWTDHAHLP
jgi:hypothetical protein